MTAISASSVAAPPVSPPRTGSPKQRLLDQIAARQQAGSLSAADAGALTSAVQDIDQAMTGASKTGGGTRLDPAQARSRIDDLIGTEVDKGTLTSDQATTLKGLLSSRTGHGGPEGAGNPPPGPLPSDASPTDAASRATSASDLLSSFLARLQDAQGQTQASGYGAGGSGTAATTGRAAVFDFEV